jgi:7,8-dihydroneopterin aldolase/epimerase/oxygenase
MSQIFLEGLEFYAYHGCFREEQLIGTWFNVDVVLWGDFEKAAISDNLEDTVNYLSVYQTLKTEMEVPTKLLETVVVRMLDAVLSGYPLVDKIEIKLSKMNPPLGGKLRSVSVKMDKNRL